MSDSRVKRSRKAERLAKVQRRTYEATQAERRVDQAVRPVERRK